MRQPRFEPIVDFGTCLRQILREKGISASELARLTAYKSRNSIFRILDSEGGHGARAAFFDRLLEKDCLQLSARERAQLAQALEVSRVGASGFLSNCLLREMLMGNEEFEIEETPRLVYARKGDDEDFGALLRRYASGRKLTLTILGCCDRWIFEALRTYLLEPGAPCRLKVEHFFYTGGDEIIKSVSAIQPMLYARCYTAYCIDPGCFTREREQIYRNNWMIARWEDADGIAYEHLLVMTDHAQMHLFDGSGMSTSGLLCRMLSADRRKMRPLKSAFALNHSPEDYLAYTESYRRLEYNKAIYTVKPDVPINFIHPDVLVPSVLDGFMQTGFAQEAELMTLVDKLYGIQLMRWENFFTKRKATHTIFSRAAMELFARTGEQSDHFFAMRPYTPQERVSILYHLKEQTERNPYFTVYFFKDGIQTPQMEIGLYEGEGTLISNAHTHYCLEGDHAEALIRQEEFSRKYREFFTQDLLVNHVLGVQETRLVFDELIAIAERQE